MKKSSSNCEWDRLRGNAAIPTDVPRKMNSYDGFANHFIDLPEQKNHTSLRVIRKTVVPGGFAIVSSSIRNRGCDHPHELQLGWDSARRTGSKNVYPLERGGKTSIDGKSVGQIVGMIFIVIAAVALFISFIIWPCGI